MKHIFVNLTLLVAVLAGLALPSGCARPGSQPAAVFEAQPRPLLESVGLSASWDPNLAVDTSGTLYLFAVYDQDSKSQLGLAMSHDGGDTLMSRILPISETKVSIASHGEESPSLAMSQGAIYALWQESAGDGSGTIMLARSLSWGESFDKPIQVSGRDVHSSKGFCSVGVAPNGDVYAVWLDERDQACVLYVAKSTDHGASFAKSMPIADHACPCCRPNLGFGSNGDVYVVWRRVFPGDIRDMAVSISRDGGQTFAEPTRVNEDGWMLHGCPDSGPAVAESHGALSIVWMTEGREQRAKLQFARSIDGARSFTKPVNVSADVLDPNHPVMKTADDGTIWLVFQGRAASTKGNWGKMQAYLVQIKPNGSPSPPEPIPGSDNSIAYPTIGVGSGGRLFIAWAQPQGDRQTVMLTRGRTSDESRAVTLAR